jgi:hypothetical protein
MAVGRVFVAVLCGSEACPSKFSSESVSSESVSFGSGVARRVCFNSGVACWREWPVGESGPLARVARWRELPVVESLLCGNVLGKDAPSWGCGPPGDAGLPSQHGSSVGDPQGRGLRKDALLWRDASYGCFPWGFLWGDAPYGEMPVSSMMVSRGAPSRWQVPSRRT